MVKETAFYEALGVCLDAFFHLEMCSTLLTVIRWDQMLRKPN